MLSLGRYNKGKIEPASRQIEFPSMDKKPKQLPFSKTN